MSCINISGNACEIGKVAHSTCVLISSSDNTFDVFSLVSKSVIEHWPTGVLDFYVGLNNKEAGAPFRTLSSPCSNWRSELLNQINALPERYQHIILLLDDFFFLQNVDLVTLIHTVNIAKKHHIHYVRLKPVERSGLGRIIHYARTRHRDNDGIVRLTENEPYYSSLQAAVWDRSYLAKLLEEPGSIWDFEHRAPEGSRHYAITNRFINYIHLVEKGKWLRYAPTFLGIKDHDSFRRRGFQKDSMKYSLIFNKVKFFLFGYTFFRLRRVMPVFKTRWF